ncbi:MAG: hypothetical protein AB8I08_40745 [Sandaracinaceae bacterium]
MTPPPAGVAAPAGVTPPPAGISGPPAGIGGGVVAPPFGAPEPAAPAAPADPFSAAPAAAAGPQVVRLEFDDRLVQDAEVGKAQRFKLLLVALVVGVAGLGIGALGGSTWENNKIFDQTVRDAQSIYGEVDDASGTVNQVQTHLNAAVRAAAGNPQGGEAPAVDYAAIEALRSLEKPIDASAMAGKNYKALPANVTNDLFVYLMNVERLWSEFRSLVATTLPEARRAELDRTAAETAESASTRYGAVLRRIEGGELVVSLAFLSINETDDGIEIVAHGRRGDRGRQMSLWDGEAEIGNAPEHLISVDGDGSRGVLADQSGAFVEYLRTIAQLKQLADQTVELQGRIITGIAQALSDAGASASGGGEAAAE